MQPPTPFNAGEPACLTAGQGAVTLVDGTTFCISHPSGDVELGSAQGLYFRDARIISRWQLILDGQAPQPLSVVEPEAFRATFVLRRPPAPGSADSTMLVERERQVGTGMRETITLRNVGRETTVLRVNLHVDTDFADLFAVKEGNPGNNGTQAMPTGIDLVFSRGDGSRGVLVHATGDPATGPTGLSWHAVIPARGIWRTEITVQPLMEGKRAELRFRERSGPTDGPQAPPPDRLRWKHGITIVRTHHPGLRQLLRRTRFDLDALRIKNPDHPERTFLAAGAPWFMTLFGRDSLLTGWMTLPLDPAFALGTLQTLADLQGQRVDPQNEEEPGRILHELRRGPDSNAVLGGTHYYGTIDATPLFVALLAQAWRWGMSEADVRQLLPAADRALDWMDKFGDRDGDGFLEYQRATDRGLANQGWKDSWDAINSSAGHLAEPPVALAEVQGYAYAAWLGRAELADAFGEPERAANCRDRAQRLRQRFADAFWMPEQGFLAIALDGHKRQVDSVSSNAGHCLWTGIVADEHAAAVIDRLSRADMDSGFGLRTLSAEMGAYNPMSYHNGSVWPHDTAICVAGLMRYAHVPGAVELAHRLAEGLLKASVAFGGRLPELFCGFPADTFSPPVPYPTSCSPQAWASAVPVLLIRSFIGFDPDVPRRSIRLRPHLPPEWGAMTIDRLSVGGHRLRVTAADTTAQAHQLPAGWSVQS